MGQGGASPQRPEPPNLRGITVSPHISKLEPVAFYAEASQVHEQAPGGPYIVGGMKSISLYEIVCIVHMMLDLVCLRGQVVDVLITDLAKYVL